MNKGVQRRVLMKAAKISGMSDCVRLTELGEAVVQQLMGEGDTAINQLAESFAAIHAADGPLYEEV